MNAKPLNDQAMDSIVGGGTYLTDLAEFVYPGRNGPCFNVRTMEGTPFFHDYTFPTTDEGMLRMTRLARAAGSITLVSREGVKKIVTADELEAMR